MSLKTSSSTPFLCSSQSCAVEGDTEKSMPIRMLHLRSNSNFKSSGFRKARSETDLKKMDKESYAHLHAERNSVSSTNPMYNYSVPSKSSIERERGRYERRLNLDVDTMCIGGGGGGFGIVGGGGGDADFNSDNPFDADDYYQKMLEANPGNPLLLGNYGRFLHEIKNDMVKAEEYYERAILASGDDGDVLANYAKLIWEVRSDPQRAEIYFDRAAKSDPDDCYILASYAHFLWKKEEEEKHGRNMEDNRKTEHEVLCGSRVANIAALCG